MSDNKPNFRFSHFGSESADAEYSMSYKCSNCNDFGTVIIKKGVKADKFNLPCERCGCVGEIYCW